jgi:hypothetical protein
MQIKVTRKILKNLKENQTVFFITQHVDSEELASMITTVNPTKKVMSQ